MQEARVRWFEFNLGGRHSIMRPDPRVYGHTTYFSKTSEFLADWACGEPENSPHRRPEVGPEDYHVSLPIPRRHEIHAASSRFLFLRQRWLDELAACADISALTFGHVYYDGETHEDWRTVITPNAPLLRGLKDITPRKICPRCGHDYGIPRGGLFFDDPRALDMDCFEAWGLFVREDIVKSSGLRKPAGADQPRLAFFRDAAGD